ncbi:unnamed protein product [Echinostoma caproni]|uniref:DUF5107 domain-containing protein n=1 Tax=Echinostoma caproni TaxID=27848 RepID=A0A183B6H0_9TREM|nr:unnamed protein product [Echinostoma caproni]
MAPPRVFPYVLHEGFILRQIQYRRAEGPRRGTFFTPVYIWGVEIPEDQLFSVAPVAAVRSVLCHWYEGAPTYPALSPVGAIFAEGWWTVMLDLGTTPDCCISPVCSRFGWFEPAESLRTSLAMDNWAPAMVVGHGCFHCFDYTRPRSGPG